MEMYRVKFRDRDDKVTFVITFASDSDPREGFNQDDIDHCEEFLAKLLEGVV